LGDEGPRHKPFERESELGAAIEYGNLNRFPTPLACETVAADAITMRATALPFRNVVELGETDVRK
jgi:hypothetical protein